MTGLGIEERCEAAADMYRQAGDTTLLFADENKGVAALHAVCMYMYMYMCIHIYI